MKKILILFVSIFFMFPLFSCSSKGSLLIERSLKKDYVDLSLEEFKSMMDSNINFVVFVNSSTCSACKYVKETFLDDYIYKTNLKIYSFVIESGEKDKGYFLEEIAPEGNTFMAECSLDGDVYPCTYVPLILIIENKQVINYALGSSKINKKFFEDNLYIDKLNDKYLVQPNQKLTLEKTDHPGFIPYQEEIEKGIIYNTNNISNNQEIIYYLTPFMNDFECNIYLNVDSKVEKNSLKIVNGDFSKEIFEKNRYLTFLDAYTN